MTIEIEKNIPIPPVRRSKNEIRDVLERMEQGDSCYIETSSPNVAQSNVRGIANRLGIAVVIRSEGNGIRIWHNGVKTNEPE